MNSLRKVSTLISTTEESISSAFRSRRFEISLIFLVDIDETLGATGGRALSSFLVCGGGVMGGGRHCGQMVDLTCVCLPEYLYCKDEAA